MQDMMNNSDEKLKRRRNRYARAIMKLGWVRRGYDDSWYVHSRMFGDIMEPAFKDDLASRLELVSALNLMTRGKCLSCTKKLGGLIDHCQTDADLAAWHFFMGACCEKSGLSDMAIVHYSESTKYDPAFYMVYLRLAKCLHIKKRYEAALNAYIKALDEVLSRPEKDEIPAMSKEALLGSIHANAANCLLMMRRYDDAEFELYEADWYDCDDPMMYLTWATVYAATGRKAQAREQMSRLRDESPELEAASALKVREVIEQKNSRFALRSIPTEKLKRFWDWFSENEPTMHLLAVGTGSRMAFDRAYEQMCLVFDFGVEKPGMIFENDGEKSQLSFYDNYNLTFEIWLEKLVDMAPKSLKQRWDFYSTH